jgi:hypothetical protein
MPRKTQEDRVRRIAARIGLKLIKNRHVKKTYCLRPVWDATHVVAILSDGGFELASTTIERRQHVASWLPLNAIERILPELRGGVERRAQGRSVRRSYGRSASGARRSISRQDTMFGLPASSA